jgi:hypothetical protein
MSEMRINVKQLRRLISEVAESPYAVLGLPDGASMMDVMAAATELKRSLNPSYNDESKKNPELMAKVKRAINQIGTPEAKKAYDSANGIVASRPNLPQGRNPGRVSKAVADAALGSEDSLVRNEPQVPVSVSPNLTASDFKGSDPEIDSHLLNWVLDDTDKSPVPPAERPVSKPVPVPPAEKQAKQAAGKGKKTTYKIYGKLKGAPVHTRLKGRAYLAGPDTRFKNGDQAAISVGDDGDLTVTDPQSGHTQKWKGESFSRKIDKILEEVLG